MKKFKKLLQLLLKICLKIKKLVRITEDKKLISVFDFIQIAGCQTQPDKTWKRMLHEHESEEVSTFCTNIQFPGRGQKSTPVTTVEGLVKIMMWLPGEFAKNFRTLYAEIIVRYLGGDTTMINEILAINQAHIENPDRMHFIHNMFQK